MDSETVTRAREGVPSEPLAVADVGEESGTRGPRFTPFSQLRAADHPFTRDAYLHIDGILGHLAGEAAERMYAGHESYRAIMEEASAVQVRLHRLWNTVVEHERRERMSGNIVEPCA